MSQCNHCDAFMSNNLVCVFGDKDDSVCACSSYSTNAGISQASSERRASSL